MRAIDLSHANLTRDIKDFVGRRRAMAIAAALDYGRSSAYQITKSVMGGVAPSCRILDAFWPR
jgi:hypothetical protein